MDIKKAFKDLETTISKASSLDEVFLGNQQFKTALERAKNASDESIKECSAFSDDSYEMQDIVATLGYIEEKYKECRYPETKKDFQGPFEKVRKRLSKLNQNLKVIQ